MTFNINHAGLTEKECFAEASREELRVLLALISLNGAFASEEELARAAGVSVARCRSALVLWQECGVLTESDERATVIDEFTERRDTKKRYDKPSESVAASVRDAGLAAFLEECATMMGIPALSTEEIKDLEYIITDLGVSTEYVLVLIAHLIDRKKNVTPRNLTLEVQSLIRKGIDTVEALEAHIMQIEKTSAEEWEFRQRFSYYRVLSPTEKKYVERWYREFGFSIEIIYAAYGVATKTTAQNIPYSKMDRILASWHEAGCTTVSECLDKGEAYRIARIEEQKSAEKENREAELAASGAARPKTKSDKNAKYNDFDTEDALMAALRRSYGDGDEENT